MAKGEEREEEREKEGGGGEGEEEEALGTQEVVRWRGGGAPLPLHCSVLRLAATGQEGTTGSTMVNRAGAAGVVMKAERRGEEEGGPVQWKRNGEFVVVE